MCSIELAAEISVPKIFADHYSVAVVGGHDLRHWVRIQRRVGYDRRSIYHFYVPNSHNFVSCIQCYPIHVGIISRIPRSKQRTRGMVEGRIGGRGGNWKWKVITSRWLYSAVQTLSLWATNFRFSIHYFNLFRLKGDFNFFFLSSFI